MTASTSAQTCKADVPSNLSILSAWTWIVGKYTRLHGYLDTNTNGAHRGCSRITYGKLITTQRKTLQKHSAKSCDGSAYQRCHFPEMIGNIARFISSTHPLMYSYPDGCECAIADEMPRAPKPPNHLPGQPNLKCRQK